MRVPLPAGSGLFPLGSNGLASGNSLAEAVAHGAWELVERDACAMFFGLPPNEQALRRIRLDTVDDPSCKELLDKFAAAGVGVGVWDITSDVGIPAYLCSIVEKTLNELRLVGLARGYGCHPDTGVALCRALTEAAQSRLTRIAGTRDDIQGEDFAAIRSPSAIRRHQQQIAEEVLARRSFQDTVSTSSPSFEQDLEWTNRRLAARNLGPICHVELTPRGCPISVARVVIAGLEGASEAPGCRPGARMKSSVGPSVA